MTPPRNIGLYLHIPFCRQRCHFCAFYLEIGRTERIASFLSALERELRLYGGQDLLQGRMLQSIYFGGGTPTVIPARRLASLLSLIHATFPTDSTVEITVEAHPATVTADDVSILAEAGFNRISFGVESMNDTDLGPIGRPGTVQDTRTAVAAAKAAGFANINLDVMYGLPGQTLESWTETLHSLLDLDPSHLSCYALTIEEGTKLAHDIARGIVPAPDDSLQVDMDMAAKDILATAGFVQYELSNYAKPGFACRHNLLHWTDGDYLGLGPSAQSYVNGVRFGNIADLTAYADRLGKSILPVSERTLLSPSEQQRDALVFGLRLVDGVPTHAIDSGSIQSEPRRELGRLIAQGLVEKGAGRVRLTPLGQRYADTVAKDLF